MVDMRVGFIVEVPSSAGITTEVAIIEWKAVKHTEEGRFKDEPDDVHGIDRHPDERDTHRSGTPMVSLHTDEAP
jgi:hypothetical protein